MIKKLALLVALVVVAFVAAVLVLAARQPPAFTVARSLAIAAPPGRIFPLIADFHQWQAWSPYEGLDPGMQRRFEGPASGKGAVYVWSGNGKAGAGRMEIVDAPEPRQVDIRLDFTAPIEGHNRAQFVLAPEGDATRVTWRMSGPSPFVARLAGVFLDMDRMIGADFEAGLAKLKTLAER